MALQTPGLRSVTMAEPVANVEVDRDFAARDDQGITRRFSLECGGQN